jgi:hypothetical protein
MTPDDPASAPAPSRWRFQFSLRMLFLITALWAVILAWWSLKKEPNELERIETLARTCHVICRHGVLQIIFSGEVDKRLITDSIKDFAGSAPIIGIVMDGDYDADGFVSLTPDAWSYIQQLNLKSFGIRGLDDSDVSQLAKMSSLKELTLHTNISRAGAKSLRESLPNCKMVVRGIHGY